MTQSSILLHVLAIASRFRNDDFLTAATACFVARPYECEPLHVSQLIWVSCRAVETVKESVKWCKAHHAPPGLSRKRLDEGCLEPLPVLHMHVNATALTLTIAKFAPPAESAEDASGCLDSMLQDTESTEVEGAAHTYALEKVAMAWQNS
eukprot:184273-Amphidinium_carterae.1